MRYTITHLVCVRGLELACAESVIRCCEPNQRNCVVHLTFCTSASQY